MINRFLYLGYYIKNLDRSRFRRFLKKASAESGKGSLKLTISAIRDSLKYNISLLEYFQFHFYRLSEEEKEDWAGTGYMYEYQRLMNPPAKRGILDDKTLFYSKYKRFFKHHVVRLEDFSEEQPLVEQILAGSRAVLKESRGKCGLGTAFIDCAKFNYQSLFDYMKTEGYDLVESFIQQHKDLDRLSPSGVNTVRIFTQLRKDNSVDLLGCRQRISVNSPVDNLAAGNLAAPIDENTGLITGPAVYSDITKKPEKKHPVTGVEIVGFQVPFWKQCLQLAIDAALEYPANRSVGWDIVVTQDGPGLIEGNHDWCKLVWQLPVGKGLKKQLEKQRSEYNES